MSIAKCREGRCAVVVKPVRGGHLSICGLPRRSQRLEIPQLGGGDVGLASTVHEKIRACDEGTSRGGKKSHRVSDVRDLAETTHRNPLQLTGEALGILRHPINSSSSANRARRDVVDENIVATPL